MVIKIHRTTTTRLYTMGLLFIDGQQASHTVEDTLTMLEAGLYCVSLRKGKDGRRKIVILPDSTTNIRRYKPHCFAPNGSHISSRKNLSVGIGEWIIPGALEKGAEVYDSIFKYLEKAKTPTLLVITDEEVESAEPVSVWDKPSNHGCPPTKRRVLLNEEDASVDIYEGNRHVQHLTVEEQEAIHQA